MTDMKKKYKLTVVVILFSLAFLCLFINKSNASKSSFWNDFSKNVYSGVNGLFFKSHNLYNSNISSNQDNLKISKEINSLQSQLDIINKDNKNPSIIYVQGLPGPQGPKGDTVYIGNSSTTNWSSIWSPGSQYQYVPVQGPAGPAGANGLNGSYITLITQGSTTTTYYIYNPNTVSTSTITLPYNNFSSSSISNNLYSNNNLLSSVVNGNVSTTTLINSIISSSNDNLLQISVNGISSTPATIINSVTQSLSDYILTTTINGVNSTLDLSSLRPKWYAENTTSPSVAPTSTGIGSIALGDGAQALANDMFVYGNNAGANSTDSSFSNFIGFSAGNQASGSDHSNFIGDSAGSWTTNSNESNFIGDAAGSGASGAIYSNFFGKNSGANSTDSFFSNFIGAWSGYNTTSTHYSNFLGLFSGYSSSNSSESNFIGDYAGYLSSSSMGSNFIGMESGYGAFGSDESNFIGQQSGFNSRASYDSNFIGANVGDFSIYSYESNFIGYYSGSRSSYSNDSNFLGYFSGKNSSSSAYSNFIGVNSGGYTSGASYSNIFGYKAGYEGDYDGTFHMGSNNIIIGTDISLGSGVSDSINIGGVLFGSGIHENDNTTNKPYLSSMSNGRIGIDVVSPQYTLDVGNSSTSGIVAQFKNSTGYCTINPTNTSLSCTSDINLKKNIVNIEDNNPFVLESTDSTISNISSTNQSLTVLNKILNIKPVLYNWKSEQDTDPKHAGFIAQQIEQTFPDLVSTDASSSIKSVNYTGLVPYIVVALHELTSQLTADIVYFKNLVIDTLKANKVSAKQICISDDSGEEICINKAQLYSLLNSQNSSHNNVDSINNSTGTSISNSDNISVDSASSTNISDSTSTDTSLIDISNAPNVVHLDTVPVQADDTNITPVTP